MLSLGGGPETPVLFAGSAAPDERSSEADSTGTGDVDHALHALSPQNGREQWRADVPDPVRTAPRYAGVGDAARIVFATGRWSLHGRAYRIRAVDATTGARVWEFDTDERRFVYPVAATDDSVFVGRRDDQLGESGEYVYALDATDGAERWRAETGDVVRAGTAPRRDLLVVQTFGDRVLALDTATGDDQWQEHVESVRYDDGTDRVFVEAHDTVRALAVTDGSERWRRGFDASVSVIRTPGTARSAAVLVGDFEGRLLALDPMDGATRWTLSFDADQFLPAVRRTGERLFVTNEEGVHAVDPASGERQWSFAPDVEDHVRVFASSTVFASTDRHLWALDSETGAERWEFVLGNDAAAASDSASPREFAGVATAGDLAFVAVDGAVHALDGSEPA